MTQFMSCDLHYKIPVQVYITEKEGCQILEFTAQTNHGFSIPDFL